MQIYNAQSMKKGFKIVGIILGAIVLFFALIGFFCSYIFRYEAKNPHIMGNDSTYLKFYYQVSKDFPRTTYILGNFEEKMGKGGLEPFTIDDIDGEMIEITSGTILSPSTTNTEKKYNFIINTPEIKNLIHEENSYLEEVEENYEGAKSNIIELRFHNSNFLIYNFLFYNSQFQSLLDPYQKIDYRWYGLNSMREYSGYKGDFCLAFYSSNIIHNTRKSDFPDCHLIVTPNPADYPSTILQTRWSQLDSSLPTTMEVFYHQI
ncbi:MAG: hypothetical protein PHR46_03670 [Candidatus Absconditabacteria bacterium]|nr:hypothetical protein [Candidatus Absconditabacteria bacterium]